MVLASMRYKTFTFTNNPATCSYVCEKTLAKHKYPQLSAVELEDMGIDGAIISVSGEFFGNTAYDQWDELNAVFKQSGVGELYHPIFKDVTQASMKNLHGDVEPRENYIKYSFELWQHIPPVVPVQQQSYTAVSTASEPLITVKSGDRGNLVISLQKALIAKGEKLPIYGVDGVYGSETERAVRSYQSKNNIPITGIADTATLKSLGVDTSSKLTVQADTKKISYTVQSGDTLSSIAKEYSKDWKDIAKMNSIKDPHTIRVGQKILI